MFCMKSINFIFYDEVCRSRLCCAKVGVTAFILSLLLSLSLCGVCVRVVYVCVSSLHALMGNCPNIWRNIDNTGVRLLGTFALICCDSFNYGNNLVNCDMANCMAITHVWMVQFMMLNLFANYITHIICIVINNLICVRNTFLKIYIKDFFSHWLYIFNCKEPFNIYFMM